MKRRDLLGLALAGTTTLAGFTLPSGTVTENPTGEIDVEFRTQATESYLLNIELVDQNGQVVEESETEFPPNESQSPSFYAGGLTGGPFTFTVSTSNDSVRLEWDIVECEGLAVTVTLLEGGRLMMEQMCAPT